MKRLLILTSIIVGIGLYLNQNINELRIAPGETVNYFVDS